MNEFNRELCDERHRALAEALHEIKENTNKLFNRMNWFYILAIMTLAGVIANFFNHG